jgi:hypothetical protein
MATPASDTILTLIAKLRNGMNQSDTAIGIVAFGIAALGKCHTRTKMRITVITTLKHFLFTSIRGTAFFQARIAKMRHQA